MFFLCFAKFGVKRFKQKQYKRTKRKTGAKGKLSLCALFDFIEVQLVM